MKKIIYSAAAFAILIFMITSPISAVEASKTGLLLWFNTIIPTLLPFIILSNLIIHLDAMKYITFWIAPLFRKLFCISADGCYAVITGFLCGYPMGAKITADLVRNNKITIDEGNYLLRFCNNVSPMFIISFIVGTSLNAPALVTQTLVILYLAPVLCAVLFQPQYRRQLAADQKKHIKRTASSEKKQSVIPINFKLIDICIMDGFETILKLGGYIILFSIIMKMAMQIPSDHISMYLLLGNIEITNGIQVLADSSFSFQTCYLLIMSATAMGGLSSIAQTESMLKDSGLSILSYIISKVITAAIAAVLAAVLLLVR